MPNKPKVLCRNPDCSELVEAGTKLGVDASRWGCSEQGASGEDEGMFLDDQSEEAEYSEALVRWPVKRTEVHEENVSVDLNQGWWWRCKEGHAAVERFTVAKLIFVHENGRA